MLVDVRTAGDRLLEVLAALDVVRLPANERARLIPLLERPHAKLRSLIEHLRAVEGGASLASPAQGSYSGEDADRGVWVRIPVAYKQE